MYLFETIIDKKRMANEFVMPTFTNEEIAKADRLEVWCSSFKDDGADFTLFKLMKNTTQIAEKKFNGY